MDGLSVSSFSEEGLGESVIYKTQWHENGGRRRYHDIWIEEGSRKLEEKSFAVEADRYLNGLCSQFPESPLNFLPIKNRASEI